MSRVRSNTVTETGIAFFSAGGHSHDGGNSSIIETGRYSIFDFKFGLTSTNSARINSQATNERAFRDFIIKVVNQSVLEPAGIVLQDNIINARNILAGSITSDEIKSKTIKAENIESGTIVADLISAGTITGDLIAANTITGNQIVANSITALEIATNTITASEIAAGAITSELLQAGIIIGNDATFTGTVSAANILAGFIVGSTFSSNGTEDDRIVIIPGSESDTTARNSLRFISLPGEGFNQSPSIRADNGVLQISGGGVTPAVGRSASLVFGSMKDGVRLSGGTGESTFMRQDSNPPNISNVSNRGYFRNISFGSTNPSSPLLGDIHFSL